MNTSSFGVERGTLIRVPATANLMVDSQDRPTTFDTSGAIVNTVSPWQFSINRNQSLINGFFSRIGTTEVVLEWCVNNISRTLGNQRFSVVDSSGTTFNIDVPAGEYTAEDALDYIEGALNQAGMGNQYDFSIIQKYDASWIIANIDASAATWRIKNTKLSRQLGLVAQGTAVTDASISHQIDCPDLRPYRFIDFVCEQLTSVQDVKDSSTSKSTKDVLCRWYFADDTPNSLDAYGFPILQGYTKFVQRRLYNPPKQIKWEQNTPVGGFLQFSVYGDNGQIVTEDAEPVESDSNWLMTLQLSEG